MVREGQTTLLSRNYRWDDQKRAWAVTTTRAIKDLPEGGRLFLTINSSGDANGSVSIKASGSFESQ